MKRATLCMGVLLCLVLAMPSLGQPQGGPLGLGLPTENDVVKVLVLVLFLTLAVAWARYRARKDCKEEEGATERDTLDDLDSSCKDRPLNDSRQIVRTREAATKIPDQSDVLSESKRKGVKRMKNYIVLFGSGKPRSFGGMAYTMDYIIRTLMSEGLSPKEVLPVKPNKSGKVWQEFDGKLSSTEVIKLMKSTQKRRWFCEEQELIFVGGKTYALTRQWTAQRSFWPAIKLLQQRFPKAGLIVKEDTPSEPEAPIEPVETAEPVAEVTPVSEPQETPAQADEAQVEAVPAETAEPDAATAQATDAQETHVQKDEAHSEAVPSESDEPVLKLAQSASASPGANLLAKHLMQTQVHWVSVDDTVNQAQTKMQETGVSYLLVGDGTKLEGIVTRSDLDSAASIYLRPIFAKWHRPADDATLQIRLKWIMSKQVYPVKPETPLFNIVELKCKHDISCLPVVDVQGQMLGVVTTKDMLKGFVNTT
jgi:acetoin utilization protein AcuB